MAQELRLVYSDEYLKELGNRIQTVFSAFSAEDFHQQVTRDEWDEMALKARMRRITETLRDYLPRSYSEAIAILKPVSTHFSGFAAMFFPDFVELYGLEDWDISLPALAHFTQFSSSEFAVRPFILQDPKRMMVQMLIWSKNDNEHIRRLASEGCRPRLPWAQALPEFKKDPSLILPILQNLLRDDALYVRKSVANNLNDIAKDNPDIVVQWVEQHLGSHKHTDWILKHASRTLLKQAEPRILKLFSLGSIDHIDHVVIELGQSKAHIGEHLPFSFTLQSEEKNLGKLRIEYAIHFVKADGKQRRKVFKITESEFTEKQKSYSRKHSLKQMSTRKHYPGEHKIELVLNGEVVAEQVFDVLSDPKNSH